MDALALSLGYGIIVLGGVCFAVLIAANLVYWTAQVWWSKMRPGMAFYHFALTNWFKKAP